MGHCLHCSQGYGGKCPGCGHEDYIEPVIGTVHEPCEKRIVDLEAKLAEAQARVAALTADGDRLDSLLAEVQAELTKAKAALFRMGGICAKCGFRYWEYNGHIISCPRCERDALQATLEQAREALRWATSFVRTTIQVYPDLSAPRLCLIECNRVLAAPDALKEAGG